LWTRKFSIPLLWRKERGKRFYNDKIKEFNFWWGLGVVVVAGGGAPKKHGASSRLPSPLLERQHSTYLDSFHTNYIIF